MEHYISLGIRYLKFNKKRLAATIIATALVAALMYAALNIPESALLNQRAAGYEDGYELTIYTDSQELTEAILSDSVIREGSVGTQTTYDYEDETGIMTAREETVLLVNVRHPYKLLSTAEYIENTYGVSVSTNNEIAFTYFQDTYSVMYIALGLVVIFLVYIFTIIGVGIVKNSVQLSTLEQIRDYGNLRCIGATKGEVRSVFAVQCAVIEAVGIALGTIIGYAASLIVGHFIGVEAHFHFLPLMVIVIAFAFDLYFTADELTKLVTRISPADAVRGRFTYTGTKVDKIRARGKSLFGVLFGVEGDYAYKNLRRGSRRFGKSVASIAVSVAGIIMIILASRTAIHIFTDTEDLFGYYQIVYAPTSETAYLNVTTDDERTALMTADQLESVKQLKGINGFKYYYMRNVFLADEEDYVSKHVTERADELLGCSRMLTSFNNIFEERGNYFYKWLCMSADEAPRMMGLDAEDMEMCKDYLVEGTTELSDTGIILIRSNDFEDEYMAAVEGSDYHDTMFASVINIELTDYQLGDEIRIVNAKKLRERFLAEYDKRCEAAYEENREYIDSQENPESAEYLISHQVLVELYTELKAELIAEGEYTDCVIEGVVEKNPFTYHDYFDYMPNFLLTSLDNFERITGYGESEYNGFMTHVNPVDTVAWSTEDMYAVDYSYTNISDTVQLSGGRSATYFYAIENRDKIVKVIVIAAIVILVILAINLVNIINTCTSNIYLRRREFAELRAIGVSEKGLTKMVLLEGFIMGGMAMFFGTAAGIGLGYLLHRRLLSLLYTTSFSVPWIAILAVFVLLLICLVAALYRPLKAVRGTLAENLILSGQ